MREHARTLAFEEADKLSFDCWEYRNAFIEGFIEGYTEVRDKTINIMRESGMSEEQIDSILKAQPISQQPQNPKNSPQKTAEYNHN